jgi:protein gp37
MYREKRRYGQDPGRISISSKETFYKPDKWKGPARVFVCSWSDFFLDDPVVNEHRAFAWEVMRTNTKLIFQIPTKRPQNILKFIPWDWGRGYPNVWLGVSIEHPKHYCRMEYLRNVPAAIRFISFEPLLTFFGNYPGILDDCDWAIAGGESGPDARPMHPDWVRSIRNICRQKGIPFFFKQWGEWWPAHPQYGDTDSVVKFDDIAEFETGARQELCLQRNGAIPVRSCGDSVRADYQPYPWSNPWWMHRIGKKDAGRELDGRTWEEFPS